MSFNESGKNMPDMSFQTSGNAKRLVHAVIFKKQEYYNHTDPKNFIMATFLSTKQSVPPHSQPHRIFLLPLLGR